MSAIVCQRLAKLIEADPKRLRKPLQEIGLMKALCVSLSQAKDAMFIEKTVVCLVALMKEDRSSYLQFKEL